MKICTNTLYNIIFFVRLMLVQFLKVLLHFLQHFLKLAIKIMQIYAIIRRVVGYFFKQSKSSDSPEQELLNDTFLRNQAQNIWRENRI